MSSNPDFQCSRLAFRVHIKIDNGIQAKLINREMFVRLIEIHYNNNET